MHSSSLGAALIVCVMPAVALAQGATPSAPEGVPARTKVRTACAAEIQKFCAHIERGKGQMRACLEQNQASLSGECNAARAERATANARNKS